jgi:hypothetical protein
MFCVVSAGGAQVCICLFELSQTRWGGVRKYRLRVVSTGGDWATARHSVQPMSLCYNIYSTALFTFSTLTAHSTSRTGANALCAALLDVLYGSENAAYEIELMHATSHLPHGAAHITCYADVILGLGPRSIKPYRYVDW